MHSQPSQRRVPRIPAHQWKPDPRNRARPPLSHEIALPCDNNTAPASGPRPVAGRPRVGGAGEEQEGRGRGG
eukprot:13549311-Alexandrium_andersonii.AAC.1